MFVCHECESEKVEMQVWVNANTFKLTDRCILQKNDENWCRSCNQNVKLKLKHEENGNYSSKED